jgi:hypothetical protein
MKRILATACGGPSTLSFTRSLRGADPERTKYRIIGTDCDKYNIHRAEVDRAYVCPKATDPDYIPFIEWIIREERIDFLHSQPEIEAYVIGAHREQVESLGCRVFMPPQHTMELLRDKWKSYEVWRDAGIKVPMNVELNTEEDLLRAFEILGEDIWIRETVGAAGKGALSRPTFETALAHLQATGAWGHAVAAEHLSSDTVTWQSIWDRGRLVVAQGRRRLYWAFGNRAQSGVTGLTGTGVTLSDPALDELAITCVRAADPEPHGIFSVDFTYDRQGIPNPTEINIAKFFTTHHFITRAGWNMPLTLVQLAFGEYDGPYGVANPCQSDLYWIRGIDVEPVMVHREEVEAMEREYQQILTTLQ